MKYYLYSENGIRFEQASEKKIAELVLRDVLSLDTSIQDSETGQWYRIRDIQAIVNKIYEPDVKLKFNEPNIDNYLETGYDSIYYNISAKNFGIMMILTGGLFIFYWLWRNWDYANRERKTKRSFWARISDIFHIHDLFFAISRDSEICSRAETKYNPDTLAWALWGAILLRIGINFTNFIPMGFDKLVIVLLTVAMILIVNPINRQIHQANQSAKNGFSAQTAGYYMFVILIFVLLVYSALMQVIIF